MPQDHAAPAEANAVSPKIPARVPASAPAALAQQAQAAAGLETARAGFDVIPQRVRGGSDATAGQQQALATLDRLITGQAAVLSFEHAFRVIALLFLAALLAMPFLQTGRRPASGEALSVDL